MAVHIQSDPNRMERINFEAALQTLSRNRDLPVALRVEMERNVLKQAAQWSLSCSESDSPTVCLECQGDLRRALEASGKS